MRRNGMSYYTILGVSENADQTAIRHAFRAQARRYHPDAGTGASPERFREAMEAYEVLGDPLRRRRYDVTLSQAARSPVEPEPLIPVRRRTNVPASDLFARPGFDAGIIESLESHLSEIDRYLTRLFWCSPFTDY
jgi:curved DNA-binding protein CbpA